MGISVHTAETEMATTPYYCIPLHQHTLYTQRTTADTDATRPTSTHRRKLQNEQRHETVSTGSEITQLVSTYLDLEP